MGILDQVFATSRDDPRYSSNMGLFAGMIAGDLPRGLIAADTMYNERKNDQLKREYVQAQIAETLAQARERETVAAARDAEAKRLAGVQAVLPNLYRQPRMTGGEPVAQTFGGTNVPMFSQPMGAAPMQQQPGGFDLQAALAAKMNMKEIADAAALQNIGRAKVARTVEVDDGKGGKATMQLDDFGQPVGSQLPAYIAPVSVNQGDRQTFVKPTAGLSLPMNMSPDARASNALGWANNALTRRGQDLTDARARETNTAGKVPAGYRLNAGGTGLEFIPGGPADPNAAKKAAPTEFQGKSATYGARAQEADKIITGLSGQYSPMAVNSKLAAGNVPLVGGALEATGNMLLSAQGQKAEQAQRDFVNAVLRQESGAAISAGEFENARKQYFPQPFDSKEVIAQKARNRQIAIQGFLANSRPGAAEAVVNSGGATGSFADNDPLGLR
jgi:hypothetical protein